MIWTELQTRAACRDRYPWLGRPLSPPLTEHGDVAFVVKANIPGVLKLAEIFAESFMIDFFLLGEDGLGVDLWEEFADACFEGFVAELVLEQLGSALLFLIPILFGLFRAGLVLLGLPIQVEGDHQFGFRTSFVLDHGHEPAVFDFKDIFLAHCFYGAALEAAPVRRRSRDGVLEVGEFVEPSEPLVLAVFDEEGASDWLPGQSAEVDFAFSIV